MIQKAIDIDKKAFGEGHPNVAEGLWSLAAVASHGDRGEARRLWVQALAIFEKALGGDHPTTAKCRRWGKNL